jgi:hypothetical protein
VFHRARLFRVIMQLEISIREQHPMSAALRATLLAALVAPVHNYLVAPLRSPARSVLLRRSLARTPPAIVAISEEVAFAYRQLGLPEDATYDEITDAALELEEKYKDNSARLGAIEKAKEVVLDDRLRQRMSGTLQAKYEGSLSIDDRPAVKRTPIWVIANGIRKKCIIMPTPKYALYVCALLGGLSLATWLAPSTAGTILMINVMSGMGFVYNRGEPDVVRDDFGQVGEIRPMQPKPFAVTALLTAAIWLAGFIKAKQMVAAMVNPPRSLELVLRTTLISTGLILPALFFRVQGLFD